ncbi:MAG: carboxypeptidase-like regulatory domain-containing protein, partial [Bacteroidales bacterium]
MDRSRALLTILLILLPLALWGQQGITLRGRVYNSKTGDPVPQASIYVNETLVGGASDDQGLYEIKLPVIPVMIVF